MTQEEKARAYDRAIKRVEDIETGKCPKPFMFTEGLFDYIFPELKDSEDEGIKKDIIKNLERYVKCVEDGYDAPSAKDFIVKEIEKQIAWLEKQGEQNKINSCKITFEDVLALECAMKTIKITKGCDELYKILVPLYNKIHNTYLVEKRGEQEEPQVYETEDGEVITYSESEGYKVVKSNFKRGDWIVQNGLGIYKIVEVCGSWYEVVSYNDGIQYSIGFDKENDCHLWTIADAKDGDVLACNEEILLFKSYSVQGRISLYCRYNGQTTNFHSKGVTDVSITTKDKIYPATKEQRELLFKKMHEAGYTFDFDKKELKKVEQKSAWSKDDNSFCKENCKGYQETGRCFADGGCKAKREAEQNPAWSEEDVRNIENIDSILFHDKDLPEETCIRLRNWLKSIKQKIGGVKL